MSNMPDYQEARLSLEEVVTVMKHYIGDDSIINVKETLRLMIGQYFYGETPKTIHSTTGAEGRTLVWPIAGQTLFGSVLTQAFEDAGEVFWVLADTIGNMVLSVNKNYQHRANDCFYKFYPETTTIVVYVPVVPNLPGSEAFANLAGPAVVTICADTLPSYYRA